MKADLLKYNRYFEANKDSWNKRTIIHKDSEFYNLPKFRRTGNCLNRIELEGLMPVEGKSLLHLQCHFGMDTISFSKMGANCTGVDFSEEAVKTAKLLNEEMGTDAEFINCNVYDLETDLDKEFDIVFASYGVIGWLPDLAEWFRIASRFLKKGGIFYLVEFHPYLWMMNDDFTEIEYSYFFSSTPIKDESSSTYADRSEQIEKVDYGWNHSISEILNSMIDNSIRLEHFDEYPFSTYDCFPNMVEKEEGKFVFKNFGDKIPYLYSIKGIKV